MCEPRSVTDAQIVEDFRAYVEWAPQNPPTVPAPYPTVGTCASIYCYVHTNDHGDQVHSAVWTDVYQRGEQDHMIRP